MDNEINKRYPGIISTLYGSVWAIQPQKLEAIVAFIEMKAAGLNVSADEIAQIEAAKKEKFFAVSGNVAVVPVYGTIAQRMDLFSSFSGGTSTERIGANIDKALSDDTIGAIILDIDSPGGSVYGVAELGEKIYNSRSSSGGKPIIAIANSLMASAAFWLGSAADELVITPGGEMGSVGVVAMHADMSKAAEAKGVKVTYIHAGKYKVEGNPYNPLDNEALSAIQGRVDDYYSMFVDALARNRNVSTKKVLSDFGQGRVFGANEAVSAGMADRVSSFEELTNSLRGKKTKKSAKAASRSREIELARINGRKGGSLTVRGGSIDAAK